MVKKVGDDPDHLLPLLIVGAGPHAMTLVLRLLEDAPGDTYNDNQHSHMSFWRRKMQLGRKKQTQKPQPGNCHEDGSSNLLSTKVRVIDPAGEWMTNWKACFNAFDVSFLRSPIIVHPDPLTDEGLREFAQKDGRLASETKAPPSFLFNKNKRQGRGKANLRQQMFNTWDRERFAFPSKELFEDFCSDLVQRYDIRNLVEKDYVKGIDLLDNNERGHAFQVTLGSGKMLFAARVVLATGAGTPRIPAWALAVPRPLGGDSTSPRADQLRSSTGGKNIQGIYHSADIATTGWMPRYNGRTMLIVGGGLTAVQLADKLLRLGSRVILCTRRPISVQQFDVPVEWLSPFFQHYRLSEFYGLDIEERCKRIRAVRGRASVPLDAWHKLHETAAKQEDPSTFTLLEETVVEQVAESVNGSLEVKLANSSPQQGERDAKDRSLTLCVSGILLATGTELNIDLQPLLSQLKEKFSRQPETIQGLPVLTEELRWAPDHDLFVVGAFAALQLGPTAGNLMGARAAASRLAEVLLPSLRQEEGRASDSEPYHPKGTNRSTLTPEAALDSLCRKSSLFQHLQGLDSDTSEETENSDDDDNVDF